MVTLPWFCFSEVSKCSCHSTVYGVAIMGVSLLYPYYIQYMVDTLVNFFDYSCYGIPVLLCGCGRCQWVAVFCFVGY